MTNSTRVERRRRVACLALSLSTILCSGLAAPALAQDSALIVNPNPPVPTVDLNGVDRVSGALRLSFPLFSIGDQLNPIAATLSLTSPSGDGAEGTLSVQPTVSGVTDGDSSYVTLSIPGHAATFYYFGTPWSLSPYSNIATLPGSSSVLGSLGPSPALVRSNPNDSEAVDTVSFADGTTYTDNAKSTGRIQMVRFSNGETWSYYYAHYGTTNYNVLKYIVSSRGYGVFISYSDNGNVKEFRTYNKANIYCDETTLQDCAEASALPVTASIAYDPGTENLTIADATGKQTVLHYDNHTGTSFVDIASSQVVGLPDSLVTYTYQHFAEGASQGEAHVVASVTSAAGTWTYANTAPDSEHVTSVTLHTSLDPAGNQTAADGERFSGALYSYRDELGRYYYNPSPDWYGGWLVMPEGNQTSVDRTGVGAISEIRQQAKPGSGLPDAVVRAEYPDQATCTNYLWCFKPSSIKDADGNQTDFLYDPVHGGLLTKTEPPNQAGIRPQSRYTYVQRYAWIKGSGGTYNHAETPIWLIASESYCRDSPASGNTSAPCVGNDEVRTIYDYGPDSGPNNLLLHSRTVSADGPNLTTCFAYDVQGNKVAETSPLGTSGGCPSYNQ